MIYFDPHERRSTSPVYHDYMRRWEPTERAWRWIEYALALGACLLAWLMMSGCSIRSQEIAVVSAASADVVSTEIALSRGGSETNPLMENRAARIAGKAAATTLVIVLSRSIEEEHPRLASVARMSTFGLWAGAAMWNVTVAW